MPDSDSKDNIITQDPSQESPEIKQVKHQPNYKKEIKANIIDLVENRKITSLEQITKEIDYGRWLIKDCLKELKEENVLEERK